MVSDAWGEEAADTLFDLVAPAGDRVATGRDVDALRAEMGGLGRQLRGEMATLGAELRGDMAASGTELRGDMATLGAELRGEIAEMRAEMGAMEHRIVGSFERRMNEMFTAQTRTLLVSQLVALVHRRPGVRLAVALHGPW